MPSLHVNNFNKLSVASLSKETVNLSGNDMHWEINGNGCRNFGLQLQDRYVARRIFGNYFQKFSKFACMIGSI